MITDDSSSKYNSITTIDIDNEWNTASHYRHSLRHSHIFCHYSTAHNPSTHNNSSNNNNSNNSGDNDAGLW